MDKMTVEQLQTHWRNHFSQPSVRFGQYVMNTDPIFNGVANTKLYYETDSRKAFDYILENYCKADDLDQGTKKI